jgi:hypothetical protein
VSKKQSPGTVKRKLTKRSPAIKPKCLTDEMLDFLDEDRDPDKSLKYMLSAALRVKEKFNLEYQEASLVFRYWCKTYCERHGITETHYDSYHWKDYKNGKKEEM